MHKKLTFVLLAGIIILLTVMSMRYFNPASEASSSSIDRKEITEASATNNSTDSVRPEIGYTAPDFELSDLDGNIIRLSELRGQPVFINFWATWCPPCKEEMPVIQKAYEAVGKEVKFLAINLTATEESLDTVRKFMSNNGYTFSTLLDMDNSATISYQVRGIPTSFFIDSQGIIRFKYTGAMNEEILNAALSKIIP